MKFERLEMLRGAAAVYVVVHHFFEVTNHGIPEWLIFPFVQGQAAVMLFFVLSGFVIRYSIRNVALDKIDIKKYLIHRFRRIYPIFLIAIAIPIGAYYLSDGSYYHAPTVTQIIGNILNVQDMGRYPGVVIKPFLNNPLWSLSYEWFFYFFFIVVTRIVPINYLTLTSYILGFASIVALKFVPGKLAMNFFYLPIWWSGVELANLYLKDRLNSKNIAAITGRLLLILLAFAIMFIDEFNGPLGFHPNFEIFHYCYVIGFMAIGLVWRHFEYAYFDNLLGVFTYFAPISYSLYVLHYALAANIPQIALNSEIIPWYIYLAGIVVTIPLCYLLEVKIQPKISLSITRIFNA